MLPIMTNRLPRVAAALTILASLVLCAGGARANSNIAGKKVIFVPISMGISLTEAWARGM